MSVTQVYIPSHSSPPSARLRWNLLSHGGMRGGYTPREILRSISAGDSRRNSRRRVEVRARDISPRYNGRWCLQSSLSTAREAAPPLCHPAEESGIPYSSPAPIPFPSVASLPLPRRPGGEFASLAQTEARPLDHFNAFLCFRSA